MLFAQTRVAANLTTYLLAWCCVWYECRRFKNNHGTWRDWKDVINLKRIIISIMIIVVMINKLAKEPCIFHLDTQIYAWHVQGKYSDGTSIATSHFIRKKRNHAVKWIQCRNLLWRRCMRKAILHSFPGNQSATDTSGMTIRPRSQKLINSCAEFTGSVTQGVCLDEADTGLHGNVLCSNHPFRTFSRWKKCRFSSWIVSWERICRCCR